MRTLILIATMTAGSLTAVAQTPAPQAPSSAPHQGAMVTVVGCLTLATTAAPTATAMPAQYVLTDHTPPVQPVATKEGSTSSGATPAGSQKPARKMYVLVAHGETLDFSKHVNHTVRATGATTAPMTTAPLAGRSPEAAPVTGATAPAGATGTPFDTTNLPTLAVTTLAMVSSTCQSPTSSGS